MLIKKFLINVVYSSLGIGIEANAAGICIPASDISVRTRGVP
jgi:hypothetical protein